MTRRLEAGDDLVLFPEGTSGDGNRVLAFKSALFSVAERRPQGEPLTVQPVSIAYTRLDGLPLGRYLRPFFAWYGDMELGPHLWHAIGLGRVTVMVEFRSEEHTSELQSLMRISYAVLCLNKKNTKTQSNYSNHELQLVVNERQ